MGSQISLGQWGLVLLVLDCLIWLAIDSHDCPARLTSEGDNVREQLTEPVFRLGIDHSPLTCLSLFCLVEAVFQGKQNAINTLLHAVGNRVQANLG